MSGNGGDGLGSVILEVFPNLSGSMQIGSNHSLEGFRWTKLCGALKDGFHSSVTARMRQDSHSLQLLPSHTCQAGNLGDGQRVEGIHPASVQDPNPKKAL